MNKIVWIIPAFIFLFLGAYVAVGYFNSPSKDQYFAVKSLVTVGQQYLNNQDIDTSVIKGSDENAKYVRNLAEYMQIVGKSNRELTKQKNLIIALAQPRNLAATQSLDTALERVDQFDKTVDSIQIELETAVQDLINKMNKLDRKRIIFDVVTMVESMDNQKPQRQRNMQLYSGLSQYVRAVIQFAKSRAGYFDLENNGKLVFKNAADQDYYNKLTLGIDQYIKQIDVMNTRDINQVRKEVGSLAALISK